MHQLRARYLLFSDAHWMVVPPEKQRGVVIRGWDRLWDWLIFRRQKRKNNANVLLTLYSAFKQGRFDKYLSTGDLVECIFNERGILTQKDIDEILALKEFIRRTQKVTSVNEHYVPGDHDGPGGYDLPIKADPRGGMNIAGTMHMLQVLGPLFDAWKIGIFHFVTISSSLFSQKTEHLDNLGRLSFKALKQRQEKFLTEYLVHVPVGEKVFLLLHDPDALEIVDTLPGAEKITKVLCGHFHQERNFQGYKKLGKMANSFWGQLLLRGILGIQNRLERANRIIAWAKRNPRRLELFQKYNLTYVPSAAETRNFLVLELYDNGEYKIQRFTT